MLRIERSDNDTFTLVSDDQNAENIILGDAFEQINPHMATEFNDTAMDEDGMLRFDIARPSWVDLMEVLEYAASEGINTEAMYEQVKSARQEGDATPA